MSSSSSTEDRSGEEPNYMGRCSMTPEPNSQHLLTSEDKARFNLLQEDVEPAEGELPLTEEALAVFIKLKAIVLDVANSVGVIFRFPHNPICMGSEMDGGLNLVVDLVKPNRHRLSIVISATGKNLTIFWINGLEKTSNYKILLWDPKLVTEYIRDLFTKSILLDKGEVTHDGPRDTR